MTKLLRASLIALLGLAVPAPLAVAGKTASTVTSGHMSVRDDGEVFSPGKVSEAEGKFNGTTFKSPTYFTVRTFGKVPDETEWIPLPE